MNSTKLIKYYQTLVYWSNKLCDAAECWRAREQLGIVFTDLEYSQLREAEEHFARAKTIVSAIYSKRIGDAITREILVGEYKGGGQ